VVIFENSTLFGVKQRAVFKKRHGVFAEKVS
jgi:hypothetical protein